MNGISHFSGSTLVQQSTVCGKKQQSHESCVRYDTIENTFMARLTAPILSRLNFTEKKFISSHETAPAALSTLLGSKSLENSEK